MPETTLDLLYLMAEVSIATVALSGITMVLAVSNVDLTDQRAALIGAQLRLAFIVTAFSIFPLLLLQFDLSGSGLWRMGSAGYFAAVAVNIIWSLRTPASLAELPGHAGRLVGVTAVSAISLLSLNLWLAKSWPYLTQLCVAWSVSTLLFLGFIHEVLGSGRERGGR